VPAPSFSPYPFARLRRLARRDATLESAIARWLDGRGPTFAKLVKLASGPVSIRFVGTMSALDPHASLAEIRANGLSLYAAAPSRTVRALAQRWLGGPDELDAARPLAQAEHAIWCLVVAAAIADSGIDARVWPAFERSPSSLVADPATVVGHVRALAPTLAAPKSGEDFAAIELAVVFGHVETTVVVFVPRAIEVRAPAPRTLPAWSLDLPIVVGRAAIPTATRLAAGDIVIVEHTLELEVGDARIGLTATARAVEAKVATGYIPRDMALPDDAHLELTVQLGTTRLSLRALSELVVGQVISLGRPLAGPFDVRAGGRLVGQGELIDIDGELGVRIVSVAQE
jgi:flagellar motor switch/type III secretory pathway protein FliN